MDELCNNTNIAKIFTSSYNPRANGQAERTNQTFTNIIQKYAIENRESWPDFIPYAQLAYNTKINSTTKYSPFELVFGKKMNKFSNWNEESNDDDETKLLKRSLEIKILCEETQPKALENIEKAQKHQKKSQDKQLKGDENNKLSNGTKEIGRAHV